MNINNFLYISQQARSIGPCIKKIGKLYFEKLINHFPIHVLTINVDAGQIKKGDISLK